MSDTSLHFHELSFLPEGDDVLVGRPGSASYAVLPVDGGSLLERLVGGASLAEAADWYEAAFGEASRYRRFRGVDARPGIPAWGRDVRADSSPGGRDAALCPGRLLPRGVCRVRGGGRGVAGHGSAPPLPGAATRPYLLHALPRVGTGSFCCSVRSRCSSSTRRSTCWPADVSVSPVGSDSARDCIS